MKWDHPPSEIGPPPHTTVRHRTQSPHHEDSGQRDSTADNDGIISSPLLPFDRSIDSPVSISVDALRPSILLPTVVSGRAQRRRWTRVYDAVRGTGTVLPRGLCIKAAGSDACGEVSCVICRDDRCRVGGRTQSFVAGYTLAGWQRSR